jgi:UDP-N-acetylglucosamine 4,6-dehydratase
VLITEDDARHTLEFDDYFIIEPEFHWWSAKTHISNGGKSVEDGFVYASNLNDRWLTVEELVRMVQD